MILVINSEGKLEAHSDFVIRSVDCALPDAISRKIAHRSINLEISYFCLILIHELVAVVNCELMVVIA